MTVWAATVVHSLGIESQVSFFPQFENAGGRQKKNAASFRSPNLAFALLLTLAALTLPAFAAVHPIPLERTTDAAKCLECHVDKTKGKAVHSAIALGCL